MADDFREKYDIRNVDVSSLIGSASRDDSSKYMARALGVQFGLDLINGFLAKRRTDWEETTLNEQVDRQFRALNEAEKFRNGVRDKAIASGLSVREYMTQQRLNALNKQTEKDWLGSKRLQNLQLKQNRQDAEEYADLEYQAYQQYEKAFTETPSRRELAAKLAKLNPRAKNIGDWFSNRFFNGVQGISQQEREDKVFAKIQSENLLPIEDQINFSRAWRDQRNTAAKASVYEGFANNPYPIKTQTSVKQLAGGIAEISTQTLEWDADMGKYRVTNTTIDRKDSANFTEADVLAQARIDEVLIAENIGKLTKEGQEKFLELQREIPDNLSPAQRSLQVAKNITEVSRQKEYRANQKLSEEEAALLRLRSSLIANALTQEFSPYRNEDGSINMEKFNADMAAAGLAINALELETGTGGTDETDTKKYGSVVTKDKTPESGKDTTDTDLDGTNDKTDDIIQNAQAVTDAVNENPLLRTTLGEYFNQVKKAATDPNKSKFDVTEIALGGLANQAIRGGSGAVDFATETVLPGAKSMGEYFYDFYALSPNEYQDKYGALSYEHTERIIESFDKYNDKFSNLGNVVSDYVTRRDPLYSESLLAADSLLDGEVVAGDSKTKESTLAALRSKTEQQATAFQEQTIRNYTPMNAQSVSDTVDVVGALLNDTPTGIEFMKRVVNAESEFGQHPDTYNVQGNKGSRSRWGVAQVTEKAFNHVQNRLKSGNAKIARYIKPIQEATGIDLREVTFEDMNNPLISILYGRLYVMQKTKKPIPKTIDGQGAYYEEIYSGIDGTGNFFVRRNLPTGRPVDDRIASAE